MNKKKKIKRKSRIVLFVIFVIICAVLYFVLFKTIESVTKTKVLDEITGYNITLEKRDTELMQTTFNLLKSELSKKEIDYEKYAEYISKLFIIDLYTLDNKKSKTDVGGVEYVYTEYQSNYKLNVQDTIYASIGTEDDLPEVSSVEITNIEESKFVYNEKEFDAYNININWEYKEDLGYDTEGIITLIKDNKKLYVAALSTEVES